jgi:hypothetical protein
VWLRAGKNEDHVARGLFQSLEEGVERCRRETVDFVHDVHLVPAFAGCVRNAVAQVTNIFHARVRRRIDLDDIKGSAFVRGSAGLALVARITISRLEAVHRFREDSSGARLARTPGTREKVGMRDFPRRDCMTESPDYMLLAI